MLKKEYANGLWNSFLKFIKIFQTSKNPSTICWILEMYFLMTKKYSPKVFIFTQEIINEYRIKKEMHNSINSYLLSCSTIASNPKGLFFTDSSNRKEFPSVIPYPPSVYNIYVDYLNFEKEKQNSQKEEPAEAMKSEKKMFEKAGNTDVDIINRYRIWCFKTLKFVALQLLQNSYSPEKLMRIASRVQELNQTKEFMDPLLPLMDNKGIDNQLYAENSSELLYSLVERARTILIKDFKKPILDIFLGNVYYYKTGIFQMHKTNSQILVKNH